MHTDIAEFDAFEAPNEAAIRYFMSLMKLGEGISMPTLARKPGGRYAVIDGRSRIAAAMRLGAESCKAYVVEATDPEKLAELRRLLNARTRDRN